MNDETKQETIAERKVRQAQVEQNTKLTAQAWCSPGGLMMTFNLKRQPKVIEQPTNSN